RPELLVAHAAARALLQVPTAAFLSEALDCLAKPGLLELDRARSTADAGRARVVHARENNPFLVLGGFLDAELVDLDGLDAALASRLREWSFPAAVPPEERLARPGEAELGQFLQAFQRARPGVEEALSRLWTLLGQVEERGEPLLELFLSFVGAHRGGLQRMIYLSMPAALGRFIQGKTDRHLAELSAVAAHLPVAGPLVGPLRDVFDRARRALMAECRDLALLIEGNQRGDMVLVEVL
ncbi:MAG: hypothetical protein ACYDA8_04400, partial [Deferrisomatales bacterium]